MSDFNLVKFLELYKEDAFNLDLEEFHGSVGHIFKSKKRLVERKTNPDYEGVKAFCNKAFNEIEDKILLLAENGNIGLRDKPLPRYHLIYVRMYFEYKALFVEANNALSQNKSIKALPDIKDFFNELIRMKERDEIQKVLLDHYAKKSDDKIADYLKENEGKFKFVKNSKKTSMTNFFKILLGENFDKNRVDNIKRKVL